VSEVEVFDSRRCELGESPHYDERTGRVWWVDVLGRRVLWRTPSAGESGWLTTPAHVGAAVPTSSGRLVVCLPAGPSLLDPVDGRMRPLARYPDASPGLRSNDAKADRDGRLWLGTMAYDESSPIARLYRLDAGAVALQPVLDEVTVSNGLGWSPDGRLMYYVDSPTKRVDVFDFESGYLKNRRTFATIDQGFPDGLCVDADGGVWVAIWLGGAVRRYLPDGTLDRVVRLATPLVTSCAFAGPDFRTLIITTAAKDRPDDSGAGLTYAHYPMGVHGLPADVFAG
jgi:sugar lactone lactonase YvrE